MEEEKSYDKLWDEVFKSTAEELAKVAIDPFLENAFITFEDMSVIIEQNELPDTRSPCYECLPTSTRKHDN